MLPISTKQHRKILLLSLFFLFYVNKLVKSNTFHVKRSPARNMLKWNKDQVVYTLSIMSFFVVNCCRCFVAKLSLKHFVLIVDLLSSIRSRRISHLVSPLKTVLDDSIGCALWFAARGRGHLRTSTSAKGNTLTSQEDIYSSKAKVISAENWRGLFTQAELMKDIINESKTIIVFSFSFT